jgi:CspA family cold shock protein
MSESQVENNKTESVERESGQVKWFNTKTGFGFITASTNNDEEMSEDIFVHHTAIDAGDTYRYLTEGELITFERRKARSNNHTYEAANVRAPDGGVLNCLKPRQPRQSRQQRNRVTNNNNSKMESNGIPVVMNSDDGESQWMLVKRKNHKKKTSENKKD